jgi:hypothetical protein
VPQDLQVGELLVLSARAEVSRSPNALARTLSGALRASGGQPLEMIAVEIDLRSSLRERR